MKYERAPQHDKRSADYAGDAWRNTKSGEIVWVVVGYTLSDAQQRGDAPLTLASGYQAQPPSRLERFERQIDRVLAPLDRIMPDLSLAQMAIMYICIGIFMVFAVGIGIGMAIGSG